MNVTKLRSVNAALRTLSEEERQTVFAWFDNLANWENDPHTRELSKSSFERNVRVLDTSDDIRIFFKVDPGKNEITVLDIAKPSRFKTVPTTSE